MSDSIPESQFAELADIYDETYTAAADMFKVVQATITYRRSGPDADDTSLRNAVDSYVEKYGEDLPFSSYYR
jgi:hypothetical protein